MLDLPTDSPLKQFADRPALVILLRSFGCTFCREAMADVAAAKDAIRASGADLAFVHGGTPSEAAPWFAKFGLADVLTISDPGLAHYRAFGLGRTTIGALIDPKVWRRGAACALSHGFGVQTPAMLRQLPGVFLVQGNRVVSDYRHSSPADRPNYLALVNSADTARL
ncbi:MAG: SelL-related redox protein [Vicinamibacterales bacterium]